MKSRVVWGLGCWAMMAGAVAVACTDKGNDEPVGGAGEAGQGAAGHGGSGGAGGNHSIAGEAGEAGEAGDAGHGGGGAPNDCESGLHVLKQVESNAFSIISWPGERRFGVNGGTKVSIYQVGDDGSVSLLRTLDPAQFDAAGWAFSSVATYGDGLVAVLREQTGAARVKLARWSADGHTETLLGEPDKYMTIGAAAEGVGIAVSAGAPDRAVYVAKLENGTWSWSAPIAEKGRRLAPLAFDDARLLVGVEEIPRGEGGAPSEGGAGGEGGSSVAIAQSPQARIEYWTEQGEREQSELAFGNPSVALSVDEHTWLIGETNSFWGSYNAGLELLAPGQALRKLTNVPVISAGDGTDGATDLALLGDRLLVANCESGLLSAPWSTASLKLTDAPGPWASRDAFGSCSIDQVEVIGDVVALSGAGLLTFARACK